MTPKITAALRNMLQRSYYVPSPTAVRVTPLDARIAVIGAGAAGLTAAYTLKKLGYTQVTVYECNADVGGKVQTVVYEGRPYELGAVWYGKPYRTIRAFMDKYGVRGTGDDIPVIIDGGVSYTQAAYAKAKYGTVRFARSVLKFLSMADTRYASIWAPGFAHVDPDLHLSCDAFARLYDHSHRGKIGPVVEVLRTFLVGCGYGYFQDIPVMYYLKLAPWIVQRSARAAITGGPPLYRVSHGWQELWRAVARDLEEVRVNTPVTSVVRYQTEAGQPRIRLTAGGRTEVFDRLLITPNPDLAGRFMDFTPVERALFAKVKYVRFAMTLMTGGGLPHCFLKDHSEPGAIGHVVAIGKTFADREVYSFYQQLSETMTTEQAMSLLHADVQALGGHADTVLARAEWSYFPHVSTADASAGFYRDLEALQGEQATYYINSLAAFEDVEHVATYAQELVESCFVPGPRLGASSGAAGAIADQAIPRSAALIGKPPAAPAEALAVASRR